MVRFSGMLNELHFEISKSKYTGSNIGNFFGKKLNKSYIRKLLKITFKFRFFSRLQFTTSLLAKFKLGFKNLYVGIANKLALKL